MYWLYNYFDFWAMEDVYEVLQLKTPNMEIVQFSFDGKYV